MTRKKYELQQGDDPDKSIKFRFDLSCPYELGNLAHWLTGRTLTLEVIRKARRSTIEKVEGVAQLLIANLLNAHVKSPRCFLAVSLNRSNYVVRPRYQPFAVSYDHLAKMITHLANSTPPMISVLPGFNDRRPGGLGRVTRIRATGYLIEVYRRYFANLKAGNTSQATVGIEENLQAAGIDDRISIALGFETIGHPAALIRLKDTKGVLVDYEDDAQTKGMRERLMSWDQFLTDNHHVDLCLPDTQIERLFDGLMDDPDEVALMVFGDNQDRPRFVEFERVRLYRVFNNNSWDQGGRFYGGWWQQIPSVARRYITINGGPTKEFDYSNLHPAMLYAMEGLPLPDDAYAIEGINPKYRKLIKRTFNSLLNVNEGQRIEQPREHELPEDVPWDWFQAAILEKHASVARHMGTGIGLRLQKTDSDIAENVMLSMMAKDKLALPVHDSFIVHSGLERLVTAEMKRAFRETMRSEIGIKADPTFLEWELRNEAAPAGVESPDILEVLDWRETDDSYAGYQMRSERFTPTRPDEWDNRFGPGRNSYNKS